MKIRGIDRTNIHDICREIEAALKPLTEKLRVSLELVSASYTIHNVMFKLKVTV
jgi:hypothetical protein